MMFRNLDFIGKVMPKGIKQYVMHPYNKNMVVGVLVGGKGFVPRISEAQFYSSSVRAAITTEDGIVAGMKPPVPFFKTSFTGEAAGYFHNLLGIAGQPGAATLGTPGMGGTALTYPPAIGGALDFQNPALNAYLSKMSFSLGAATVGFLLYDLLWYQSGIAVTTTTAQTINSVELPARSSDATTGGLGVIAGIHTQVATTNGSAITNTTYAYTNESGTGSRTAGLVLSWPATAVAGTFVEFGLQGSDRGVRSIQTVTLGTSYGGGTINLMLIRKIAFVPLVAAPPAGALLDWAQLGFPQLFNNSCLYMMVLLSGTAAGLTYGDVSYSHG